MLTKTPHAISDVCEAPLRSALASKPTRGVARTSGSSLGPRQAVSSRRHATPRLPGIADGADHPPPRLRNPDAVDLNRFAARPDVFPACSRKSLPHKDGERL